MLRRCACLCVLVTGILICVCVRAQRAREGALAAGAAAYALEVLTRSMRHSMSTQNSYALSPASPPSWSDVHRVKLSRKSCIMSVESL